MLNFVSYWREMFRLLRDAPNNPLVIAGAPWRSGYMLGGFALLQVVASLAYFLTMLLVPLYIGYTNPGGDVLMNIRVRLDAMLPLSAIVLFAFGAIEYPITFLVYTARWTTVERLQDLYLTSLRPREIVFGIMLWPTIIASIFPITAFVTYACVAIGHGILDKLLNSAYFYFDYYFLLGIPLLAFLILLPANIKLWLHTTKHRWKCIVLGPLLCIVGFVFAFTTIGILSLVAHQELSIANESTSWVSVVTGICIVIAYFRSAGKSASSLFLCEVDPEPFLVTSVIGNELLRRIQKETKPFVKSQLAKNVSIPWIQALKGYALSAVVLFILVVLVGLTESEEISNLIFSLRACHVLFIGSVSFVCISYIRASPDGHFPIMNGAPITSVLRIIMPSAIIYLMLMHLAQAGEFARDTEIQTLVLSYLVATLAILIICILVIVPVAVVVAIIAVPGRTRYVWLALLFAVPVADISSTHLDGIFRGWYFFNSEIPEMLAWFLMPLLIYNAFNAFQRLYERQIRQLPLGETPLTAQAHKNQSEYQ